MMTSSSGLHVCSGSWSSRHRRHPGSSSSDTRNQIQIDRCHRSACVRSSLVRASPFWRHATGNQCLCLPKQSFGVRYTAARPTWDIDIDTQAPRHLRATLDIAHLPPVLAQPLSRKSTIITICQLRVPSTCCVYRVTRSPHRTFHPVSTIDRASGSANGARRARAVARR